MHTRPCEIPGKTQKSVKQGSSSAHEVYNLGKLGEEAPSRWLYQNANSEMKKTVGAQPKCLSNNMLLNNPDQKGKLHCKPLPFLLPRTLKCSYLWLLSDYLNRKYFHHNTLGW